jgi:hypothetical protein
MSPLLEPPPTEKSARTTSDTTLPQGAFRGTDGSNPPPSSGESDELASLSRGLYSAITSESFAAEVKRRPDLTRGGGGCFEIS